LLNDISYKNYYVNISGKGRDCSITLPCEFNNGLSKIHELGGRLFVDSGKYSLINNFSYMKVSFIISGMTSSSGGSVNGNDMDSYPLIVCIFDSGYAFFVFMEVSASFLYLRFNLNLANNSNSTQTIFGSFNLLLLLLLLFVVASSCELEIQSCFFSSDSSFKNQSFIYYDMGNVKISDCFIF
jgi:protein-S-isoprenylcysteine O-methyltransferase Ste14